MRHVHPLSRSDARRGVILMVVLALLTIFAVLGLSFVLYANSQAKSSDALLAVEANQNAQPGANIDTNTLATTLFTALIYGQDDVTGIYSAYRGHDFARSMYGYNYVYNPATQIITPYANNVPYNGVGRIHEQLKIGGVAVDGYNLVNYTCFQDANGNLVDGGLRDPERMGVRTGTDLSLLGTYAGGLNVSYTYPDANNLWLGAVRAGGPSTTDFGAVLIQSFHRPWLGFGSLDPANQNWYVPSSTLLQSPNGNPLPPDPTLKYMVLRPRPVDQLLNIPGQHVETWDYVKGMPYDTITKTYRTSFFPPPADAGGDVKSLVGSPGTLLNAGPPATYANNDSFWMDFGFPVLVTNNGRKYKPLVAQLILPLDNVVNVNVHGNVRGTVGTATANASNQGWGPWEVNLNQVLNADPQEWVKLFRGQSGPTYGRYGPNGQPGNGSGLAPWNPYAAPNGTPHFYSQVDFDAVQSGGSALSASFLLPSDTGNPNQPFFPFPYYPVPPPTTPSSYTNGDSSEATNHPSLYGYFQQRDDDRLFPLSNMEALLRFGDVGTDAIRSELMMLCQSNLNPDRNSPLTTQAQLDQAKKIRRLLTTLSMDYDRPGVTPWLRTDLSAYQLLTTGAPPYPTNVPMPFPTTTAQMTNNGEFGSDTRASDAYLGKIDLNRLLTPYPTPASGVISPTDPQLASALSDRQQLAQDLLDRLRFVTTGQTGPLSSLGITPGTPRYDAIRWLAQLAVNIVDYIDDDDYITPFHWDPARNLPTDTDSWVYGTELPRVVLNEGYVEYANDPGNPTGTSSFDINCWVELLNTFSADPVRPSDTGIATLQTTSGVPSYQIVIADSPVDATFRAPGNTTGDPSKAGAASYWYGVTTWGTPGTAVVIQPNNQSYNGTSATNQNGFFVVGPAAPVPTPFASFTPTYQVTTTVGTNEMSRQVTQTPAPGATPTPPTGKTYGIYLQRLACPALPMNATTNPWITVDYIPGVTPNYAIQMASSIAQTAAAATAPGQPPSTTSLNATPSSRFSFGRKQPYAAAAAQLAQQQPNPPYPSEPEHTFFFQNADAAVSALGTNHPTAPSGYPTFSWLTHLDRQLVSPIELLHVSMYKPHELTQQFMAPTGSFQHRLALAVYDQNQPASWNQSSLLWRAFEFFTTRPRAIQSSTNSRVPGRININNVWDIETWRALCDAQGANGFTPTQVDQMFYDMMQSRGNLATAPTGATYFFPTGTDRPFRGSAGPYSAGAGGIPPTIAADTQYPNPMGIGDTLLRPAPPTRPNQALFEIGVTNPSRKYELLNKIYNNLTVRSNVFAVWMTVGFFEVIDDTTRPVKLGAEIGLAQHQNIRHRMFAIIDRTNIRNPNVQPAVFLKSYTSVTVPTTPPPPPPSATVDITVDALGGAYEGTPWSIQAGTQLVVDVGPNQELVTVIGVNTAGPNTFRAQFFNSHPEGFLINLNSIPGNPGPQPNYNPMLDTAVLRYFSIIN